MKDQIKSRRKYLEEKDKEKKKKQQERKIAKAKKLLETVNKA